MSIPKTSKAAVLVKYKEAHEIQDIPIPKIEGSAILVKVHLAGICGTDIHQADGDLSANDKGLPVIQGHETIGEIVELGPTRKKDVAGRDLKVGDRIVWSHDYCNECYQCSILHRQSICMHSIGYGFCPPEQLMGGFSEYEYIMPTTPVCIVPEDVTDEEAVGVGCAFRTAVNAFESMQKVKPIGIGDTVVIQGAGPVGLYATIIASQLGAGQVITIGAPEKRLELAREWGASATINLEEVKDPADRKQIVLDLTEGRGADMIVECSGFAPAVNEGFDLMMRGGSYLIIGQTTGMSIEFKPSTIVSKGATIFGNCGADITHFYRALKFLKAHKDQFPMDRLISNHYKLEEVDKAMAAMKAFTEIKPVLDMRDR